MGEQAVRQDEWARKFALETSRFDALLWDCAVLVIVEPKNVGCGKDDCQTDVCLSSKAAFYLPVQTIPWAQYKSEDKNYSLLKSCSSHEDSLHGLVSGWMSLQCFTSLAKHPKLCRRNGFNRQPRTPHPFGSLMWWLEMMPMKKLQARVTWCGMIHFHVSAYVLSLGFWNHWDRKHIKLKGCRIVKAVGRWILKQRTRTMRLTCWHLQGVKKCWTGKLNVEMVQQSLLPGEITILSGEVCKLRG